jgi:signal transduction histidine kinase
MRNGKATLHKHLHDLGVLSREVAEDQRLLTSRQIILDLPQQPIKMQIDGDRMSQVLINLISNAVKYSPDQTPVEVKLKAEQNVALLSVRDHGKGIAKDQLDHIFETFYRTPDAQSSSKRGLGLGLSIARDIVERHNGRIWCESAVGDGSTFFVELPLDRETVAEGKEE